MARSGAALGIGSVILGLALVTGVLKVGSAGGRDRVRVAEEVPVTAMDQGIGWANNSPALVADPADSRFVVMANRLDAPTFSCALQVSGDGGRSWLTTSPVPKLPPGAEKCYAPEADFDANGLLQVVFVGLAGPGNEPVGAYFTSSADRGRTWSDARQVLGPFSFGVRMAIDRSQGDNGRMHLVWIRASDPPSGGFGTPPNPIMAAHSDDGGKTFSEPTQVSDAARQLVVGPALALGPDHAVYVGYYDLGEDVIDYYGLEGNVWEGRWSLVVATSSDGGGRFASGVVVDDGIVPHERALLIFTMPPPALVAGESGRLCAAWADGRFGDGDALLRCSTDRGVTWQDVRRLNDDPRGNGRTQDLPRLAVAPGGRLDAIFNDRRDDEENVMNDVTYTFSNDWGGSFTANQRLTRDPSTTLIGQEYTNASVQGRVEFGGRLALLSRDERVVAAWTDTRNSRPGSTGQDIFATVVDVPHAGSQPVWARVAGGALVVGGLAGAAFALTGPRRQRPAEAEDSDV